MPGGRQPRFLDDASDDLAVYARLQVTPKPAGPPRSISANDGTGLPMRRNGEAAGAAQAISMRCCELCFPSVIVIRCAPRHPRSRRGPKRKTA
jgi:hypothetical protein